MYSNPHGLRIVGFVAGLVAFAPMGSAQVIDLTPNLEPYPAYAIGLDASGSQLMFSTTSWNSGLGPLELRAGETSSQGQNVYQRIYRSDGTFSDHLAGTFDFHESHNHFHFNDYALYTLQRADAPGGSDRTSSKTTFCVMDTDRIDGTLPGSPLSPVYTTCNADVQGMSVGYGDTYIRTLPGQSIDVTGLPEGDYRLVITIDPKSRIIETNEGDNESCMLIHLKVPSSVAVLDPYGCDAVTVAGITPNSASAGSSVPVTISGSGFRPWLAVSFENALGSRPTVGGVSVSADGTVITATVTVKKGGKAGQVWDLRVGTGVLADAFAVTR
jgi:hypothetical protein